MKTNQMSEEFKANLNKLVEGINKLKQEYWEKNKFTHTACPTIEVDEGNRYIRLWSNDHGRSRYCYGFVDKTNGDCLKAASWKAPAKHARGNIFNPDYGLSGANDYGFKYLK